MLTRHANRETSAGGSSTETDYTARRVTYDSDYQYQETRARFDEQVPLLDGAVAVDLVVSRAPWSAVRAAVDERVGPTGLVAMARIDQGALLSLRGEALDGTLYLVGNPIVAGDVTSGDPAAVLYVPFRVAVYRDTSGVHLSYDHPSSVLGSLDSAGINEIAIELDRKIQLTAEATCR
jgi:uncharacterized protein (DUF302 family)